MVRMVSGHGAGPGPFVKPTEIPQRVGHTHAHTHTLIYIHAHAYTQCSAVAHVKLNYMC